MLQVITEKVITARVDKTELVKKLLSEGHIDFDQALLLLEKEVEYKNAGTITTGGWNPLPGATYTTSTISDDGNFNTYCKQVNMKELVFISACPDDLVFSWQYEVLIENLRETWIYRRNKNFTILTLR